MTKPITRKEFAKHGRQIKDALKQSSTHGHCGAPVGTPWSPAVPVIVSQEAFDPDIMKWILELEYRLTSGRVLGN
jgi:hypothetical protein